jgi:hypothetical protein
MPNQHPKGIEQMRELARRGGIASGETRRLKRAERIVRDYAGQRSDAPVPGGPRDSHTQLIHFVWEATHGRFSLDEIAWSMRPVDRRGGPHDSDWRCPRCHKCNCAKSFMCGECGSLAPANGRITRTRLDTRALEHRIAAILAKHG